MHHAHQRDDRVACKGGHRLDLVAAECGHPGAFHQLQRQRPATDLAQPDQIGIAAEGARDGLDQIGPGFDEAGGAVQRFVAVHHIGARHDQQVGVEPGIHRRMDLGHRLANRQCEQRGGGGRAALGAELVFDRQRGHAGFLEGPHGACHIEHIAVAGVGIRKHRLAHHIDHMVHHAQVLGQGVDLHVGLAQQRCRDAEAGGEDAVEVRLVHQQGRQRVLRTGKPQRVAPGQALLDLLAMRLAHGIAPRVRAMRCCR